MDKIDFLNYERLEEWLQDQVEKERKRIDQDAHDKVYNRLATLAHITENAINSEKFPKETLKHLHKSLREINAELQCIINSETGPKAKESNNQILEQLIHICREHAENYKQELQFTCWPEETIKFNPKDMWHIECIIQECLNNIGKHSEADVVRLSFEADEEYYILRVKDNGKGMKDVDISSGKGLKGLYGRAEKIGGRLNINSNKKGTNITLKIPQN